MTIPLTTGEGITRKHCAESRSFIVRELRADWSGFAWLGTNEKRVAAFYTELHDWYRRRAQLLDVRGEDVR